MTQRLFNYNKEATASAIPLSEIGKTKRLDAATTVAFQTSNHFTGRIVGRIHQFLFNHLGFRVFAPVKESFLLL